MRVNTEAIRVDARGYTAGDRKGRRRRHTATERAGHRSTARGARSVALGVGVVRTSSVVLLVLKTRAGQLEHTATVCSTRHTLGSMS